MSNMISALVTILLIGIGITMSVHGYEVTGGILMIIGVFQSMLFGDLWDKVFK